MVLTINQEGPRLDLSATEVSSESKQEQEGKRTPDLIVSVESRKGGVGKTTTALCLARRLLKKHKYAVLLLDLDVTGTNAADFGNASFWKSDICIVKQGQDATHASDESEEAVNLLTLFETTFMNGKVLRQFAKCRQADSFLVDNTKVNILGSQIYRTENREKKSGDRDKIKKYRRVTCIERPSILFSELHSFWLLEFVKQLITNFTTQIAAGQKVAIILDNSPGYVGIAPAIHEWLTDLGPKLGKFLMVTSLDVQDMLACERATDAIHDIFKDKWDTSELFCKALATDDSDFIGLSKEQEKFFLRLATLPAGTARDSQLAFYKKQPETIVYAGQQMLLGKVFYESSEKYIGALINKAFSAVKNRHIPYRPIMENSDISSTLYASLRLQDDGTLSTERMVPYDDYIDVQFSIANMRGARHVKDEQIKRLIEFVDITRNKIRSAAHQHTKGFFDFPSHPVFDNEPLEETLDQFSSLITGVLWELEGAGLKYLRRLIQDEWLPGSIIPVLFRPAFEGWLRELGIPAIELIWKNKDYGALAPRDIEATKNICDILYKRLLTSGREPEAESDAAKSVFAYSLASLVSFALHTTHLRAGSLEDLTLLLNQVMIIELRRWREVSKSNKESIRIEQFLAQEACIVSFDKEMMSELLEFEMKMKIRSGVIYGSEFTRLYRACAQAQSRIINVLDDSLFVLTLVHTLLTEELKGDYLMPFIKGIANDVIVDKEVSHDDAVRQMASRLKEAQYYEDFDVVVDKILGDWEICNA